MASASPECQQPKALKLNPFENETTPLPLTKVFGRLHRKLRSCYACLELLLLLLPRRLRVTFFFALVTVITVIVIRAIAPNLIFICSSLSVGSYPAWPIRRPTTNRQHLNMATCRTKPYQHSCRPGRRPPTPSESVTVYSKGNRLKILSAPGSTRAELSESAEYKWIYRQPHQSYYDILGLLSRQEQLQVEHTQNTLQSLNRSHIPQCGSWQNSYQSLHNAILDGKVRQQYLVYQCDGTLNCGGLSDRLLGMVSTFLIALLTDRAWIAHWESPIPLEQVFESPSVHWSYNPSDDRYRKEKASSYNMLQWTRQQIDAELIQRNMTRRFPQNVMHVYLNRGIAYRLFQSGLYATILSDKGLRPHTAYGCVIDFLFRPIPSALRFISEYEALLTHPSIFTIGIQIRTGDPNMLRPYMDKTSLNQFSAFFSCAAELAQTYASPMQHVVYLVITDSARLRDQAAKYLPRQAHILVTGLSIEHMHRRNDSISHISIVDGVQGAVIENRILAMTDFRVISQGGFGKTSTFMSKTLYRTVVLRPHGNKSFRRPGGRTSIVDCTQENAFTSYVRHLVITGLTVLALTRWHHRGPLASMKLL